MNWAYFFTLRLLLSFYYSLSYQSHIMKKTQPAKTLQNVINSAIYHLNLRDHSISELKTKLEAKTDNQEWVDTVIAQMKGYGYLKEISLCNPLL